MKALNKLFGRSPQPATAEFSPRSTLPAKSAHAPAAVQRQYAAAKHSRLTAGWVTGTTSADTEIRASLDALRGRCRALDRDSPYAKRAKKVVVDNVIGSGIGLKGNVRTIGGSPIRNVNKSIETTWRDWFEESQHCHTGGELSSGELERLLMGEVFEAGEVFIRLHKVAFAGSPIPFALEVIESERVPHGVMSEPQLSGNLLRMGIEVDKFYRPAGYWVRDYHPSDFQYPARGGQTNRVTFVPADEMIHLRLITRWPQTRGAPWLHAVAKKLNDMDGYSEAEIVAARGSANYMAAIEKDPMSELGEEMEDGRREIEIAPGIIITLNPGEKMNFHNPTRPNTALDPFMRYMLRETAAGSNVSYESISRDYSQSNYSSSRLSLLEDRDAWRILQSWFILKFRRVVFRHWLQQAVLAGQVKGVRLDDYVSDHRKFEQVRYKPRGWGWVDPQKEVKAFKEAEKAGYTTKTQIIAEHSGGRDIDDVFDEREEELALAEEKELKFDTDNGGAKEEPPAAVIATDDNIDGDGDGDGDEENDKVRLVK